MLRLTFCVLALVAVALAQVPYDVNNGRTPDITMIGNFGDGNEYFIRDGMDGGKASWAWDKASNIVELRVTFNGLPRDRQCYPRNPSTAYNAFPDCVENGGKWRFTIVHHVGNFPVQYYYNSANVLVGSEYDYYGQGNLPTMGLTVVNGTGTVMLLTETARIDRGRVDQVFRFRYHSMQNFLGTNGILDSVAYTINGNESTRINLYSHANSMVKQLPSFSFEDILNDINAGGSLVVLPTYHPHHEPADLLGRDNLIRGPIAMMTTRVAGGWDRLYDTPTCWASLYGTAEQKLNPFEGNVQVENFFTPACLFLGQPYTISNTPARRNKKSFQFATL